MEIYLINKVTLGYFGIGEVYTPLGYVTDKETAEKEIVKRTAAIMPVEVQYGGNGRKWPHYAIATVQPLSPREEAAANTELVGEEHA